MSTTMQSSEKTVSAAPLQLELRDWFAGQALIAMLEYVTLTDKDAPAKMAILSYRMADAMLAERSK